MGVAVTGMTVGQRKIWIEFDRAVEQAQRLGRGNRIALEVTQWTAVGSVQTGCLAATQ